MISAYTQAHTASPQEKSALSGPAQYLYDWLDEGGYSAELVYDGAQHAYIQDADQPEDGAGRVPVRYVRELLTAGRLAKWPISDRPEDAYEPSPRHYQRYRPAWWVARWNAGERPWPVHHSASSGACAPDSQHPT